MIERVFYQNYDLDSLSYKYGKLFERIQGNPIKGTGAASVSLYSVSDLYPAFGPVLVGDYLYIYTAENTVAKRRVATKVSNDEITVDTVVTVPLAGLASWYFAQFRIGTADTDGWHPCQYDAEKEIHIDIATVAAAGGVDVLIQGQGFGTLPATILSKNYAAAEAEIIPIMEPCASLRVGLKGGSGFAGTDDISITYQGTPRR